MSETPGMREEERHKLNREIHMKGRDLYRNLLGKTPIAAQHEDAFETGVAEYFWSINDKKSKEYDWMKQHGIPIDIEDIDMALKTAREAAEIALLYSRSHTELEAQAVLDDMRYVYAEALKVDMNELYPQWLLDEIKKFTDLPQKKKSGAFQLLLSRYESMHPEEDDQGKNLLIEMFEDDMINALEEKDAKKEWWTWHAALVLDKKDIENIVTSGKDLLDGLKNEE